MFGAINRWLTGRLPSRRYALRIGVTDGGLVACSDQSGCRLFAWSEVERVVAVHDCGRPINPKLTESQIYGGVIQGVSYALYEERHLDAASGHQLNANVDQYKIVGAREVPQIEVHLLEQLGGQSSTDARGVAEPANVATAAAVANAFYNATGKRIRTLPMTPANVLAALRA